MFHSGVVKVTEKEFFNRVTKSKKDLLGGFLAILSKAKIPYCVIGGLAVNAYVEPLVTLDLDIVIAMDSVAELVSILKREKLEVKNFAHSINIYAPFSNLRIQIRLEESFQRFIKDAVKKDVLGYEMYVAQIRDVVRSKVEAATNPERRPSKRDKDLLDIRRLIETEPSLKKLLPLELSQKLYPKNGKLR